MQHDAQTRYANNLIYIQNSHPDLFTKLSLLDLAIAEGQYSERLMLVYKDEGYFDIEEIESGLMLYGENSVEFAGSIIPQTDFIVQVQKAIFFGTGVGTHICEVDERAKDAGVYLLVEDDLEFFRLSLFVTDYAMMAAHVQMLFSVMEDMNSFKETFLRFYKEMSGANGNISYFTFSSRYSEKSQIVQKWLEEETASEETVS